MRVIRHQHVSVNRHTMAARGRAQEREKHFVVGLVAEDRNPVVSALDDVHAQSWNEQSFSPSHGPLVSNFRSHFGRRQRQQKEMRVAAISTLRQFARCEISNGVRRGSDPHPDPRLTPK